MYCPQTRKTYVIPIVAIAALTLGTLRLDPTRNGQLANIRWAHDYELTAERIATLFGQGV